MEGFDDVIRGKLAALDGQPTGQVPDWDDLGARLDGEAFDTSLRDALTEVPAPVPGVIAMVPGWDRLAGRLDAEGAPAADAFDDLVGAKLRRAAPPAANADATASWRRLSHRMDTFWPLRRRLVRYRVLEVAAAAAVVLTLLPMLRDERADPDAGNAAVAGPQQTSPRSAQDTPAADLPAATLAYARDATAPDDNRADYPSAEAVGPAYAVASPSSPDDARAAQPQPRTATQLPTPLSLLRDAYDWIAGERAGNFLSAVTDAVDAEATHRRAHAGPHTFTPYAGEPQGTAADANAYASTQPLRAPGTSPLRLSDAAAGQSVPVIPAAAAAANRPWRLAVDAGPRVWHVRTPARRSLRLAATTAREPGLGARATLTRALGSRAEVGLGLGVSTIEYDPDFPTLVQDGRFQAGSRTLAQSESLDLVRVTVAKLPVDVRYDVLAGARGHRRLRLWAKAGIAANVALGNEYGLTREVGEIQTLSAPAASEPEVLESPDGLYSENVTPGFFEPGGELAENAFVTARLGLEAEVTIGKRASLFAGLDYDRFLSVTEGLGPTDDQLSQLSTGLGLRVSL